MTDNAKKNGLRGHTQYYYVFSIGTEREHRGKGHRCFEPDWEVRSLGGLLVFLDNGFRET
jgi:hypothetical protein